jgi:hypothetical protein
MITARTGFFFADAMIPISIVVAGTTPASHTREKMHEDGVEKSFVCSVISK